MSSAQAALSPVLLALEGALGRMSKRAQRKADKGADTFCAEGHLRFDALTVSINGLGPLASPLPPATAQALHTASSPARHGQRDKTVLDKRVRDTGELHPDQLSLRWAEGTCDALQAEVDLKLKLPRFRGHFFSQREGVRDALIQAAVPGAVS